jgi:hypothetical protein
VAGLAEALRDISICAERAISSGGGKGLPLFALRRRIPKHAVSLK